MATSSKSEFLEAVKTDTKLKRLQEVLASGVFTTIDPVSLSKELIGLHTTKSVSQLSFDRISARPAKVLAAALLSNQGYRSRAVAIKIDCFEISKKLEERIETASKYLLVRYNNQLSEFKTAKDKQAAVDLVLEDFLKLNKKLESTMYVADRVIDDLDKAGWAIKNVIDLFNLQAKR